MNTWKNNNVLTRIEESYFLEEDTSRETTSGLPSDARPVGGTIFYIDETADGTYEFFDVNGNVIEDVQVGDKPYAYRVVAPGTKDKYYVYYDKRYKGSWASEYDDHIYDSLGTSTSIGSGKTNTEILMTLGDGAYVSVDAKGKPTIWYQLQQARNEKVGGCDDWFVPSKGEIDELRSDIKSGSITGGAVAGSSYYASIFTEYIWSSSEFAPGYIWGWAYTVQSWGDFYRRRGKHFVFFTRAF